MRPAIFQRTTAVAGAAAVLAASLAATIAQRTPPTSNFISELGVRGRRLSRTYRTGEVAAAVACIHLGLASIRSASRTRPRPLGPSAASEPVRRARRGLLPRATQLAHGELRGLALTAAGGCLLVSAALPSSAGCPVPLLDGAVPGRDWVHVPTATAAFYLFPMAARGPLRTLLIVNLVLLAPITLVDPHGPLTAMLQRTMTTLAAVALSTWTPTRPAARTRNLSWASSDGTGMHGFDRRRDR